MVNVVETKLEDRDDCPWLPPPSTGFSQSHDLIVPITASRQGILFALATTQSRVPHVGSNSVHRCGIEPIPYSLLSILPTLAPLSHPFEQLSFLSHTGPPTRAWVRLRLKLGLI